MSRLRLFLSLQRSSLRALFRTGRPVLLEDPVLSREITHPSQFCRCFVGPANATRDVLADHEPGCKWVAAMCDGCTGTGWCVRCGGDGTSPDWDPDKTAPQRPSALRIA